MSWPNFLSSHAPPCLPLFSPVFPCLPMSQLCLFSQIWRFPCLATWFPCLAAWFPYLAHGFLVSQHDFLVLLINSFWKPWSRRIHCMFQIPKTHFPCWDIHVWSLYVTLPLILDFFLVQRSQGGGRAGPVCIYTNNPKNP